MQQYRYSLERYNGAQTRHVCPQCGEPGVFVRYIDTATGQYLDTHVGKCNRQLKCNYHYPPRQYFEDKCNTSTTKQNSRGARKDTISTEKQNTVTGKDDDPKRETPYIPFDLFKSSLRNYDKNSFVRYLLRLFGKEITERLIAQYYIGTTNFFWKEDVIFWYIDSEGIARAGQVKHFDTDGHTSKYVDKDGKKQSCTNWVHIIGKIILDRHREPYPEWLIHYLKSTVKVSCLFGEHLLNLPENRYKPVAVVEAPKTAIIASVYLPKYVWVATGSFSNLTVERCKALEGRNIVLYPDACACEAWKQKAEALSSIARVTVSDLIEQKATPEQRKNGWDLADYLVQFPIGDFLPKELHIPIKEVIQLRDGCKTGPDFDRLHIRTLKMRNGILYDILFHEDDEPVKPGEKLEVISRLAAFFEKQFVPATLGEMPCLVHLDPRSPYHF